MRLLCYMMTVWITCCSVGTRQVDAEQPHIVFLIAEKEYQTEKTLPDFYEQYVRDGKSSFVYADPDEPNKLIGSEAVDTADLLFVSVRRRTLPPQQLNRIRRMFNLVSQLLVYARRVMLFVYVIKSQKMALLHGQNSTKQCLVETTQIITRTHSSRRSRE